MLLALRLTVIIIKISCSFQSSAPTLCVDIPTELDVVPEVEESGSSPQPLDKNKSTSKAVSFQVGPHSPDSSVHTGTNHTYGTSNVKSFR